MKILNEADQKINIFKQPGWANLKSNKKLDLESLFTDESEIDESLMTEDIYTDLEVGSCFRIPGDPNRTVYEIDEIKDVNGTETAFFGSHGHEFHTTYESAVDDLKQNIADGLLEILPNEEEKQKLRQY